MKNRIHAHWKECIYYVFEHRSERLYANRVAKKFNCAEGLARMAIEYVKKTTKEEPEQYDYNEICAEYRKHQEYLRVRHNQRSVAGDYGIVSTEKYGYISPPAARVTVDQIEKIIRLSGADFTPEEIKKIIDAI